MNDDAMHLVWKFRSVSNRICKNGIHRDHNVPAHNLSFTIVKSDDVRIEIMLKILFVDT